VICICFLGIEVLVGRGRDDSVNPGLFVLVSGSGKSCSGKLFGVETIWRFLRGVVSYWKGTFDGFGSVEWLLVLTHFSFLWFFSTYS